MKITRRGVAISPKMNKVRLYILFFITPILTWYAHQSFTNPLKRHVVFELCPYNTSATLHIFHETSFKKENLLYIHLKEKESPDPKRDETHISYYNDSLFCYKWQEGDSSSVAYINQIKTATSSISYHKNTMFVEGPYTKAVICFKGSDSQVQNEQDLLIALGPEIEALQLRNQFKPRLTISLKKIQDQLKSNIYYWNQKHKVHFSEERYDKLVAVPLI